MLSREHDRSLWLILYGDKKNRGRIIKFMRSIPHDLYVQINRSIDEYNNIKIMSSEEPYIYDKNLHLLGEIEDGDVLYWYDLVTTFGAIIIGKSVKNGDDYIDIFSISIDCSNAFEYNQSENFEESILGEIEYISGSVILEDGSVRVSYVRTCYDLMKTPFCAIVISTEKGIDINKRHSLLSSKSIPRNFYLEDLISRHKNGDLPHVKTRKKNIFNKKNF